MEKNRRKKAKSSPDLTLTPDLPSEMVTMYNTTNPILILTHHHKKPNWSHVLNQKRATLFSHTTKALTTHPTDKAPKLPIFQRNTTLSNPHFAFSVPHILTASLLALEKSFFLIVERSYLSERHNFFKITEINHFPLLN